MATNEHDAILNYKGTNGDMNIVYPATKWDNVQNAPDIEGHLINTSNPHAVTKAQVGLSNADDTSDLNKPVSTATQTALNNKVDKSGSKVLSDNNYTTTEKTKLAGIATGANNYVHPATHPATMIVEDETHRFTSDDEKASTQQAIDDLDANKANSANSSGGFEAGAGAKTMDRPGGPLDAIQLGSGTNTEFHTLKIYNNTLLNADGKIPLDRIPDFALGVNTIYLVTPDATISQINSASHYLSYNRESDGKRIWEQVQEIIDANTSETVQTKLVFIGKLIVNESFPEVSIIPRIIIKSGIIIEGHFQYTGNHIYENQQHLFDFASDAKNCGIQNSTLYETVNDTVYNNSSLLAGGTSGANLTNVFLNNIKYINPRNVSVSTYNMSTCFDLSGNGIYISNLSFDIATPRYGNNCVVKVGGANALVENIQFGLASFELAATNSTVLNCTMTADNGYNYVFYVSGTKNYIENIRVNCAMDYSNRTTITNGNKLVGVIYTVGSTTTVLDSPVGADNISITDTGNYYTGDTVETALQEIGTSIVEKTSYGVISGLTVSAQSTPNMTVNIATGVIYMANGKRFTLAANTALAINAAHATYPRIDLVYVNTSGVISYLTGTAAVTPAAPTVPTGGLALAEITVAAGVTSIVPANIADRKKGLWTEAWITPTLLSGWVAYNSNTTPKYRKDNSGRVTLRGLMKNGPNNYYAFILPAGYRPLQSMRFILAGPTIGYCIIDTNGYVTISSADVTSVSLDSISFYTD